MESSSSSNRAEPKEDDGPAASFPELLGFCSRSQALIAELLLLSARVPAEFRDCRFDPVLFDFRFFDSPNDFESKIEGNVELEALEDQLRESCSAFMKRFFLLVNGAATYYLELRSYLDDLLEGLYLQCTLDRILENDCGRQLLTESIALFGCFMLLMEHQISGILREKLLVAHLRCDRCFDSPNLEHICSLCRVHSPISSSIRNASLHPSSSTIVFLPKPEDLFARFPFPKLVVDTLVSRLRDDDLYNQVHNYPDPQHRPVALSLQAGCLYVLLFYSPEFLHDGFVMREIIDRFFKDHWVVPIFLHFSIDLFVSWDAYKEAKAALSSSLSPTFVRDCSQYHCTKVTHFLSELGSLLSNGVLTKDYVLDNSQHLLSLVRSCNLTLRWLLLHRTSIDKKLRDIVTSVGVLHRVDEDSLLLLLLKTSELEFAVKQLYVDLLESRETLWYEKKRLASDCIEELSGHYFGTWASSCKIKNESLKDWFGKLSLEVQSLDYTRHVSSGRIIYRVISALKDVEQFRQVKESLQIKQRLSEVQKYLQDLVKTLNLDDEVLSTFSVITDAVYAWGYAAKFGELLCKKIEQDPSLVLVLHTFFLKFRLFLSVPLLRIEQNRSPDFRCVLNYYSSEYAAQICATLETIPAMLLGICSEEDMQPFHLSNRIDKDNLQDFMRLDRQLDLARVANRVSVISEGIRVMSRNFLGLINLDLKDWLVAKLRKELSKQLDNKLKSFFSSPNVGHGNLEANLTKLSAYLHSQLQMMESFQDLLHIPGDLLWEETFTEVLKQCAQKEHAEIIKERQEPLISIAQLNDVSKAQTFFGHLLRQVLQLTDPSRSMFIEPMSGWFDAEGHELLGLHFFNLLESCVGPVGLASLDSLLTMFIKKNLEHALKCFKNLLDTKCLEELHKLEGFLGSGTSLPLLGLSSYEQMIVTVNISWEPLVKCLAAVGQLQLLRCLVSSKLKTTCKIKAGAMTSAAEGIIASVYSQREKILKCLQAKEENDATLRFFINTVDEQRKLCGLFSPLETIYISEDPPAFMGRCASIFSISQLTRYVLDTHLGMLTSRLKQSTLDFSPVVIGLGTFLKQFHHFHMNQYVQYMGQYVRTIAETAFGTLYEPQKGNTDQTSEVLKSAFWLMFFCKHMGVPRDIADSCLPPSLVAILQT